MPTEHSVCSNYILSIRCPSFDQARLLHTRNHSANQMRSTPLHKYEELDRKNMTLASTVQGPSKSSGGSGIAAASIASQLSSSQQTSQTLYMPIASPPTPAPSPGPYSSFHTNQPHIPSRNPYSPANPLVRRQFLTDVLNSCTPSKLLFISTTIAPLLKRDFLSSLPVELAIHLGVHRSSIIRRRLCEGRRQCIHILQGHTSTIRVLHNRPIAISGSRDATLRVWDVQKGKCLRVLEGHHQSVRCLDVCGRRVVSGGYDNTCRVWDVDTGECIHVLEGHFHQIYSVAFDGVRTASGGLDMTVRVCAAATGECLALLQGHTAQVCQLQPASFMPPSSPSSPPIPILATGGSDGRVIMFSLATYTILYHIAAHDSSVTSLQFDKWWLVMGGNDGWLRLFETEMGNHVRDLSEPGESVWKVVFGRDVCAVMCKRAGRSVTEIWSLRGMLGRGG